MTTLVDIDEPVCSVCGIGGVEVSEHGLLAPHPACQAYLDAHHSAERRKVQDQVYARAKKRLELLSQRFTIEQCELIHEIDAMVDDPHGMERFMELIGRPNDWPEWVSEYR